jgi:tetratricopeptide (TPR) repeat protein
MAYGEQSLAIARELNLQEQLAFTLNDLVYAYNPLLRMPETLSALEESRRLWQELDNRPMLSNNLANSSIINFQLGDYDRAIAYADEAHQLSQSIGNLWGQANSRFQIGHVYFERGQIDQAIAMMAEATQLGEPVGHPFAFISAQSDLGWVYGSLGQIDKGLELAQAALKHADELSPELAKPWVLGNLARLHLLNHDLEAAAEAVQAGAQLMRVESLQLLAPILVPLAEGEFHFAHGDYEQALTTLDNLVDWLHRGQWQPFISDALYIKGQILLAQRQIDQAFSVLSEARAQAEALGSRRTLWPILLSLSEIEAKRNSVEADLLRQQAQAIIDYIAGEIGDPALRTAFSRLAERRMTL